MSTYHHDNTEDYESAMGAGTPCMVDISPTRDGSKWGISDLYPEFQAKVDTALAAGPEHCWQADWSSKKEIVSASVRAHGNGKLQITVRVTDDFDTPGSASRTINHTTDYANLEMVLDDLHDEAQEDRKDNEPYVGFSILTERPAYGLYIGGVGQGEPTMRKMWVETYILQIDCDYDYPPGDHYHRWGWQGETEVPAHVKAAMEMWVGAGEWSQPLTVDGWTIRPWKD